MKLYVQGSYLVFRSLPDVLASELEAALRSGNCIRSAILRCMYPAACIQPHCIASLRAAQFWLMQANDPVLQIAKFLMQVPKQQAASNFLYL